jgi:hypothetical protein
MRDFSEMTLDLLLSTTDVLSNESCGEVELSGIFVLGCNLLFGHLVVDQCY